MVTGTPDISISSLVFPRTDNERDHFELSTDFYQLVTWLCSSDGVASNGWYNGVVSSTPFKNNFRPNFNKKKSVWSIIYLYACVHAPRTKIYFALIKITFLLRYYRIPGLALMNENWFPFQSLQGCRGSGKRFNGSLYHPADKRINRSRVFIKESHGTWHFPRDKSSLSLLPVPTYLLYIYISTRVPTYPLWIVE